MTPRKRAGVERGAFVPPAQPVSLCRAESRETGISQRADPHGAREGSGSPVDSGEGVTGEPFADACIRTFSYGGGWQSTAALVLASQGVLDFPVFLFANVGDDSEHPATLRYIREHAIPFADANGIELKILDRIRRDGTVETLYGRLTRPGSRSLPIPVRMSNGAPGTRNCTADFKIRVIGKELKRRGASADNPATVAIGISVDEIHRANSRRAEPHEHLVYPLLELGIRRADCPAIIAGGGSTGAL